MYKFKLNFQINFKKVVSVYCLIEVGRPFIKDFFINYNFDIMSM